MNKFSVLMAVYDGDEPVFFNEALHSIYTDQTVKPNEIVIVVDGKIGDGLQLVLEEWRNACKDLLTIHQNPINIGLGKSLNRGLELCKFNLIARMDSDDISSKDRFEVQLSYFEIYPNLVVCGSNVFEFIEDSNKPLNERRVPEELHSIKKFARYRNPINHPTVMFKKKNIIKAGGYQHMPYFEDYYLWVRCIEAGFLFYNVQLNLVSMRGGNPQLSRRAGLSYAKHELKFLNQLRLIGFINFIFFIFLIIMKFCIRVAPIFLIKISYKLLRKKTNRTYTA